MPSFDDAAICSCRRHAAAMRLLCFMLRHALHAAYLPL